MKNSLKNKRRLSHIKNLLMLALADGPLSIKEELFIKNRIQSLNLNKKVFALILENPEAIEFNPPIKLGNKILQVYDMINLLMVDNHIEQRDIDRCKKIAVDMNLMEEVVQEVMKDVIKSKAVNIWLNNIIHKQEVNSI